MSSAGGETGNALRRRKQEYAGRLDDAVRGFVDRLSLMDGVRRISVFGSYARGRRDLLTDLDLLVVMETDWSYVERLRRLYEMLAPAVDLDLFCYTPREFEAMREGSFLRRALRDERVLFRRPEPIPAVTRGVSSPARKDV